MTDIVKLHMQNIHKNLLSPLNIISGFMDLFDKDNNLSPSQINRIREINTSVEEIFDIIAPLRNSTFMIDENLNNESALKPILIVEDNTTNQELLLQQLDLLGYEAKACSNGSEALHELKQKQYHIVLTDLNMPQIDGYELIHKIRQWESNLSYRHIVIAITANALLGEKEKCLQSGMDDYLSKPLDINNLKCLLEKWIEFKNQDCLANSQTSVIKDSEDDSILIFDPECLLVSVGSDINKQMSVLSSYIKFSPEVIKDLDRVFKEKNIQKICFFSHKLKSSSYAIGAIKLADSCEQIEKATKRNDWILINILCPKISSLYGDVEILISNNIKSRKHITSINQYNRVINFTDLIVCHSILIIDDDDFMLVKLPILFQNLGYHNLLVINNAPQGLKLINKNKDIDLVVCDLNMPDMDGISLLRELSESHYSGAIILISGEDKRVLKTAFELAKAHQLRVLGFIEKPISQVDLIALLKKIKPEITLTGLNLVQNTVEQKMIEVSVDKLKDAIKNNLLTVYYQPQIDLITDKVVGAEVLVRWIDPTLGFISPEKFVAMAEEHGLIFDLTSLVLEQSLNQLNQWQTQGINIKLSINFSIDSFSNLDLPDMLYLQLNKLSIQASNIVLEVTERRLMDNMINVLEVISRLRLQGFSLSIDDFGTGYSTMEQLQKLPFTELKVDSAFVYKSGYDPEAKAILESSIALANKIKLQTVAEGVETEEDLIFVKSLGCTLAQGYYIARPMPAEKFLPWLVDREFIATN